MDFLNGFISKRIVFDSDAMTSMDSLKKKFILVYIKKTRVGYLVMLHRLF